MSAVWTTKQKQFGVYLGGVLESLVYPHNLTTEMASYINIENWTADQVADWLRGLDDALLPYPHFFMNHGINGRKLMMLCSADLNVLNVTKVGHQELILEAVELLQSLYYSFESENLQSISLQLSCKAKSLYNQLQSWTKENNPNAGNVQSKTSDIVKLSVPILASVTDMIATLKHLVAWLDRSPFESMYELGLLRNSVVKIGLDLLAATQKENFHMHDLEDTITKCIKLCDICDDLVMNCSDPLIVQPGSLEVATIRKKPDEELGMHIQSLYYGIHSIGGVKDMSPADMCGKVEKGDEVVAVNYQVVVGWTLKKLVSSLKENPKEVVLLLKKRPRHISLAGNYPNKKKTAAKNQPSTLPKLHVLKKRRSREGEKQAPRPSLQELVNIPVENGSSEVQREGTDDTDNEVFRSGSESPKYLQVEPKVRRATVSGGSPTSEHSLEINDLNKSSLRKKGTTSVISSPETPEDEEEEEVEEEEEGHAHTTESSTDGAASESSDYSRPLTDRSHPDITAEYVMATVRSSHLLAPPDIALASPALIGPPSMIPDTPHEKQDFRIRQEIAGMASKRNQPTLMKVRRINSLKMSDVMDRDRDRSDSIIEQEQAAAKKDNDESYTVTIVGGVIQKNPPIEKGSDSGDSPVVLRRPKMGSTKAKLDRRISCKDLGKGDCEGWLLHRRKGSSSLLSTKWHKRWNVLKNFNLYFYKHPEDLRAEGIIHLPSFKVSPDEGEGKIKTLSKKHFAFKIYNTGTTFIFASDRQEDRTKWMNKMGLAAISYNTKTSTAVSVLAKTAIPEKDAEFSDSDDDSERESSPDYPDSSPDGSHSDSLDEYSIVMRSLQKADVALDGTNLDDKRRKSFVPQMMASENVDKVKRLHSLHRTVKDKEMALRDIDRLLTDMSPEKLHNFCDKHPELFEKVSPTSKTRKSPKGRFQKRL